MLSLNTYVRLCRLLDRLGIPLFGSLHYIGGSDTLPAPLAREEEARLLAALEGEDSRPEARSRLIEHNLRLVVYIARRFENTGVGIEDLISIGTIGLIKAVETYKRKNANRRGEVSLDEPLNTDWDGNELLLSDVLGTDGDSIEKPIEDDVDRDLLFTAVSRLSPRERTIITMRFGLDGRKERTQKEVADLLGISQSYISRLEKRIIDRLKKEILRMM